MSRLRRPAAGVKPQLPVSTRWAGWTLVLLLLLALLRALRLGSVQGLTALLLLLLPVARRQTFSVASPPEEKREYTPS